MKKKLTFLLLFIFKTIIAQTYVFVPDTNFVTYLKKIIPTAMAGNSLNINSALVTTLTQTINVESQNISSLIGIQYFPSLNYLNCSTNSLTNLPALPNSLKNLDCSWNSINSLSHLSTSLQNLNCSYNSLTSLPVLPISLKELNCSYNVLESLPLLPDSLSILNCSFNTIKCFPRFPSSIKKIDLVSNPYHCMPNFILPAMNSFTYMPVCGPRNSCDFFAFQELRYLSGKLQSKGTFKVFTTNKGIYSLPIERHIIYRKSGKVRIISNYTKDGYPISDTIYNRNNTIKKIRVYKAVNKEKVN